MKALEINNLKKTYANGVQALKGIDLEVSEGDFFALLGPNGAGKSTTIGIITSLVKKSGGKVFVYGYDLDTHTVAAKSLIGIVPQEINFSQFESCMEIVVNQGGYYGVTRKLARKRAEKYLRQLGLWEKRNDPSRTLSGGLKRRLMIARALIHEPKLLILDEPTAGVDVELRRSMWQFLKDINRQGTTIVLTTHYLEEAENLCKNIAIIDLGNIIENTSMKYLLSKLNSETFLFDLKVPLEKKPLLPDFNFTVPDTMTIEVEIRRDQNLNELFNAFSKEGIHISSMRNKHNRLEELFIRLLNKNNS
ncbi:MAG: ABC transporter ATP-binding protein [Gammaproteobacteria bacterium]|nr:ABC transporter ATP-binding protein [Gammaproteobacteria bacterium]